MLYAFFLNRLDCATTHITTNPIQIRHMENVIFVCMWSYTCMLTHIGATFVCHFVSVLGRDEGYTVKYSPPPEGVPQGEARGNSGAVYHFKELL